MKKKNELRDANVLIGCLASVIGVCGLGTHTPPNKYVLYLNYNNNVKPKRSKSRR